MRTFLLAVSALVLLHTGFVVAQSASSLSDAVREFVRVEAPVVALTHVQVIDGTGGPTTKDRTIIIRNGRIAAVGDGQHRWVQRPDFAVQGGKALAFAGGADDDGLVADLFEVEGV